MAMPGRLQAWMARLSLACLLALCIKASALAINSEVIRESLLEPFPGNPPIVPRWAFEPWVWEDNTNTQASTLNLVQGYLDRQIPVGAVIDDSPWETRYNNLI